MYNRHRLTSRDYQGYGVYEHDLGRSLGGSYELGPDPSLGALPDLGLLDQVVMVNGLAHIPLNQKQLAKNALEVLTFQPKETTHIGGVSGIASYVLGSHPTPWVSNLVAEGNVVMIQRASVATGSVAVMATTEPNSVVLFAGKPNSDWVIVDAAPAALAAAEAQKNGGGGTMTPPQPGLPGLPDIPGLPKQGDPCPPGMTGPGWPSCIIASVPWEQPPTGVPPVPPGPAEPPPGGDKLAKAGMPAWALPAALGVGVVAVGVAVFAKKKKSGGTMRANRRAYRAWG